MFVAGTDTNATALYRITSMTLHPDFNNVSLENDVAVVKTETTVVFSAYVGPVCLPFRYATKDFTGDSATALGEVVKKSYKCRYQKVF